MLTYPHPCPLILKFVAWHCSGLLPIWKVGCIRWVEVLRGFISAPHRLFTGVSQGSVSELHSASAADLECSRLTCFWSRMQPLTQPSGALQRQKQVSTLLHQSSYHTLHCSTFWSPALLDWSYHLSGIKDSFLFWVVEQTINCKRFLQYLPSRSSWMDDMFSL